MSARDASVPPPDRRHPRRRRRRHNRHLRAALTRRDRAWLLAIFAGWALATAWGWAWCLRTDHATAPVLHALNLALLAVESVVLPLWFFFWVGRMRRPDPDLPVPDLRVAMVVTKAPSEPWPLVRTTLEAMLGQDHPHPFDVWLADEQPDDVTRAWCTARGVGLSSRFGVADYHRPTWPRRTRCKEGNLAYFYDTVGYDDYDVVVQLDADHVPAPDYLQRMVTPFTDPDVGYVAAPSMCDRNAARSWSARGRLYAEALLHGPTQAGHSGGFAPSCIGSHYAVRTRALREVGGLGPELAEDFTTTLMLSSRRWQGVFAVDAEAHGDGPETIADCLTQEFQWSRSMMNVALGVGQPYWRGLSPMAKVRLGFCLIWYPLFALLMLASVVIPVVAVATRTPFMRVGLGDFYVHFAPAVLMLVLVALWLRELGLLRPRDARAISWEIVLFQLVRWPWVLIGCAMAAAGRVRGREFPFKVTPKGREGVAALPFRVLAPSVVIALVSASPLLLRLDGGPAHGYRTLAAINVGLYLAAVVATAVLHVLEHPARLRRAAVGRVARECGATLVVAATVAAVFVTRPGPLTPSAADAARGAPAWPVTAVPPWMPTLGVTTDALAKNSTHRWTGADLGQVNDFEQAARAHAGIVQWFADWEHVSAPDLRQLRAIAGRGSTPQISWEPWDATRGLYTRQPRYRLAAIADGAFDGYARRWATALRRFGRPVLLRFAQEMNGAAYPWARSLDGNSPAAFARAWRHLHDVFRAAGATNVRWVWSPVARRIDPAAYPGDAYVDVVGLSGFNGGTALDWTGWRSFEDIFAGPLAELHAIAPHKPVQISEVGSAEAGGDKGAWIRGMFGFLARHRGIRAVLWFDLRKQTDWRVRSSPRAARAFGDGVAAVRRLRTAQVRRAVRIAGAHLASSHLTARRHRTARPVTTRGTGRSATARRAARGRPTARRASRR